MPRRNFVGQLNSEYERCQTAALQLLAHLGRRDFLAGRDCTGVVLTCASAELHLCGQGERRATSTLEATFITGITVPTGTGVKACLAIFLLLQYMYSVIYYHGLVTRVPVSIMAIVIIFYFLLFILQHVIIIRFDNGSIFLPVLAS